jgi:branched-chain amino acid aminotransferase
MELTTTKADVLKPKPIDDNNLGFGTIFTDYMFNMDYQAGKGWYNPRIEPYQMISMDPATMVLHYSQEVFEGLKAYRTPSGNIQLFRPKDNLKRMNRSCGRMCIPEIDENFVLGALKELLRLEKDWVPGAPGTSLYIRPNIIAMDPYIGIRVALTYRFYIILSPVGAYYPEGFNPVKILVTKDYVRAVPGGVGEAKTAGNYAASLIGSEKAHEEGYTQVLWLDGVERKYVEEVGTMNIFFVIDGELITPKLNGSILPGITRDSVLSLAKSWGIKATERRIGIDEVLSAHESGKLQEIFGSGTAAVISPVGTLKYGEKVITLGDGGVGPLAEKMFNTLTDMQYGITQDTMGWIEPI